MNDDIENYYAKALTVGDRANFDLKPLIQDFSFYDFCRNAKGSDNGAFLVITNKQYIIGYNAEFGQGAHVYAFARCMQDIKAGGYISTMREAFALDNELQRKYLAAKIVYEVKRNDDSHLANTDGYIKFTLTDYVQNKDIPMEQYELFQKFYREYNDEIKYVAKKFNFVVVYEYLDEAGNIEKDESQSLDNVMNYMKEHLVNKEDTLDEVLLQGSRVK